MKYSVKHGMSDMDRVRTVIEKAYESYQQRLADYDPSLSWKNDREAVVSFTIMKKKLEALFQIDQEEVRVEGDVPFLFRPFEGKIKQVLGQEVERWIGKAKAGEI